MPFGDVNIDISVLQYLEDKLKELFGQDERSKSIRDLIESRARRSLEDSRGILIAGMSEVLGLTNAYQVLRVSTRQDDAEASALVDDVILKRSSSVLFAPPGRGKSVTLQHAYALLIRDHQTLPLLYFLRESASMSELAELTTHLKKKAGKKQIGKLALVLLLDGYDEIEYSERKSLSELLRELEGLGNIRFILTCRTYYEIVNLRVNRYYLQPFTYGDSVAFLATMLLAQKSPIKAEELLEMMERRGFGDFIGNPLLLALSVVLQRGETPRVPRNAVRLLDDVVDYLAFNWDSERGVDRKTELEADPKTGFGDLDGKDLLKCLKRIAAKFDTPEGSQFVAEAEVRKYLELLQNDRVEPRSLLMEIARWFGLFVPGSGSNWSFVHRAVHEYLAAKFMVEAGDFTPRDARRNWRRAHFAACFMSDATSYVVQALDHSDELEMFVECSANDAGFHPINVIHSLVRFYERKERDGCTFHHDRTERHISVILEQDYLEFVKTPFLQEWVGLTSSDEANRRGAPIGLALALSELYKRRENARKLDMVRFGDYRWTITRPGIGREVTFTSKEVRQAS